MNLKSSFFHEFDFIDGIELTEIELYDSFLKRIAEILPMERGLVYTLDDKQEWLICRAESSKSDHPFWRCFSLDEDKCIEVSSFNTAEVIISNSVESTALDLRVQELTKRKYVLCIPLKIEKQMKGVICLEFVNGNGKLTDGELELIKLQVLFLALYIERNRFKEKLDDVTGKLFSFHHIITAINYTTQYEETIKLHLATMLDFVKGKRASLMLIRNGELKFEIALEKGNFTYHHSLVQEGHLLEEWVLKSNMPFFIDKFRNPKNGKSIIIPLISQKKALGTITIHTDSINNLTGSYGKLLDFCASHLARVIDNYNLFRDIQIEKSYIESILHSSPVGMLITDMGGKILAMNRSAASCLKLPWKGFIVESEELYCPDFLITILKDRSNGIWPLEIVLSEETNYELNYLNVTAAEVLGEKKLPVGFTVALQNVTEKKNLEKEIERVNKLAALGSAAADVAHEIRNPLTSLSLFLDEIHDNFSKKGKRHLLSIEERNMLEGALKQIDRLDKIVSTLLDFSSKGKKEDKSVDLNKIVGEIIEFIRHQCEKRQIRLETDYKKIPKTLMDEQRLKQALLNICLNAIQAMPNGGTLSAKTNILNKGRIKISISDTGSGISEENIKRVFSPFFSTKERGIGLGLSITEKLVAELGGEIDLSSIPGQGTDFSLIFPRK
jgi:signal transduction histidine kinase/GAF domain-containing protein